MSGSNLAPRLISPAYLAEQRRLHRSGDYGRSGDKWTDVVIEVMQATGAGNVLDYGCGKGALGRALKDSGIACRNYDPAIAAVSRSPDPADLIVCCDVLEHIEPDCIAAVIDHLRALCRVALFVAVSTRLAGKKLKDGRNAHILLRSKEWWRQELEARFRVKREWQSQDEEWVAMLRPKSK